MSYAGFQSYSEIHSQVNSVTEPVFNQAIALIKPNQLTGLSAAQLEYLCVLDVLCFLEKRGSNGACSKEGIKKITATGRYSIEYADDANNSICDCRDHYVSELCEPPKKSQRNCLMVSKNVVSKPKSKKGCCPVDDCCGDKSSKLIYNRDCHRD